MSLWNFLKQHLSRTNNGTSNGRSAQKQIPILVNLAFSLIQGRNYSEAKEVLLRAFEHESEIQNPELLEWILSSLCIIWEQTEQYQEWTKFFTDFLAKNPNHVLALHHRAESLWYGGSLQEAIADYSLVLKWNPNDASALLGRGQVFMECGEFDQALKDLDRALQLIDLETDGKTQLEAYAMNGRAATYAGLGDFSRALEEFEKSISLCPENAWVYFNRAEAYGNRGDRVNAVENYELALKKNQPKLTALKRQRAKERISEFLKI
jgi:tetratricopeptide (TPR) repeat protein